MRTLLLRLASVGLLCKPDLSRKLCERGGTLKRERNNGIRERKEFKAGKGIPKRLLRA